ncbi:hypothetical protein ABZZ80_15275 [Streptomyces sp. NPDC006356]
MTDESSAGGAMGGHGGRDSRGGTGGEAGLAEVLGGLSVGAEPPMPDLVPGAIRKGVRIRRRRRIGVAAGSAAMVAMLMGGGFAVTQSFLGDDRAAQPAAPAPAIRYPSLELLRSIVPESTGTVQSSNPAQPRVPGRYFRLTTDRGTADLYVAISRTVTDARVASPAAGGTTCTDSHGLPVRTPWTTFIVSCEAVPAASGGRVLSYVVADSGTSAPTAKPDASDAVGVSYLTPDGWTVQVIAGDLHKDGSATGQAAPSEAELSAIATDSRLFAAVTAAGS